MSKLAGAPVFVSYQRRDVEYARLLAERLIGYGGEVWWDREIGPGEDWRERIVAALERAEIVVLLHSAAAERSEEVQKELAVASAGHKTLIAVRLENRPPRGRFLYEMAALNWIEAWRDPADELDRLARNLARIKPGTAGADVAEAIGARPIRRSAWSWIGHSSSALFAIWAGAMLAGLVGQGLMGEGLVAARTEQGLGFGDALSAIAAFAFAPLAIVRFLADPPASLGAWLVLFSALAMLACYGMMGRNVWRAAIRRLARATKGAR